MNPTHSVPDQSVPYLFAYDISNPVRARMARKCLLRWRIDGQLSVHETCLQPDQMHEIAVELLDELNQQQDRLLVCRLSKRGHGPIYRAGLSRIVLGGVIPQPLPVHPHPGWYLLAYDIRDPRRLQCIQRLTARTCVYLQRSVYLYAGESPPLSHLLQAVRTHLERVDELRLYAFSGPRQLWFLSGQTPPLAFLGADRG